MKKKNIEITVPLNYLRNFWRTLDMAWINCEINLFLTWSEDLDLDFLIAQSFPGVNRLFVLSFEDEDDIKISTEYHLPKVD